MLHEGDISLTQDILRILVDEGLVLISHIQELSSEESQVERIISSLCEFGAAERGSIALDKTNQTAMVLADGGAKYIHEQEQKARRRAKLQDDYLQLGIKEKKRNKYYSTIALIVSFLSLVISATAFIISLC